MLVIIHSSKTMRAPSEPIARQQVPTLIHKSVELNSYLRTLKISDIMSVMHVSEPIAKKTHEAILAWDPNDPHKLPAIDSFIGDIYSGLKVHELDTHDRAHADKTLRILSGLYGVLKPLDTIQSYRLEMGYRLPRDDCKNLYSFWGSDIAETMQSEKIVINASAEEYTKAVLPFLTNTQIITPRFLTLSPKTNQPTFVVVHAKIARGAFAHWIIKQRVTSVADLEQFCDLGYKYEPMLSRPNEPVFVCQTFGGLGLSVRLRN